MAEESGIVLYGMDFSPPVRSVILTLKALELPYQYKQVNLMAGEHLSEEFLKHNPQHTVPVLDDNGTWLWDSHAINAYLVDKYGKTDDLYPKDLVQRAVVNQRLFFEASVLFPALRFIMVSVLRKNLTVIMKDKTEPLIEAYQFLETFLGDNDYVAGNTLTIADFSCLTVLSNTRAFVEVQQNKFPRINAWLERLSALPYYEEANGLATQQIFQFVQSKVKEVIV